MASASETRALALRVAKILRDRGRSEEALAILCAGAASFSNDPEGQSLLAEALRIDGNSPLARMAFERMEGVAGNHAPLEAAIVRYSFEELAKLDRTLRPGVFLRAQVGFNNNVKYKGAEYHIQTEDSGLDKPHIITHLFADGGRVIRSHKRTYASEVSRADVSTFVRTLMKGQHMEMLLMLREGRFDEIIAGRAQGGVAVLEHPPEVNLDRVGSRAAGSSAKVPAAAPATPPPIRARLHVQRSLHGGPDSYEVRDEETVVGREGGISLEGEVFCHPREALLQATSSGLVLVDLDGGNGAFVRIRRRVELSVGDEFLVGDHLLRLERNPEPNDGPGPGPTYFRSSLKWPSTFRVSQIFEGGALGQVSLARGTTLQIGAALDYANDMVLPRDPLVAPYHCVIEEQAEAFVLTDLGARSGVFVRVRGKQPLQHGDELVVGRTRLLVDESPARSDLPALG
jgi:pSer/pThr/pTyr-binding forkhead associated (FHA) protein